MHTIIMLSGKRFAGKDYIANKLHEMAGLPIVRFSDALKIDYANSRGLLVNELLTNREYKEQHREEMTRYYLEQYAKDPLRFTEIAFQQCRNSSVTIVSDLRRITDKAYFTNEAEKTSIRIITVRIYASDVARQHRGWIYNPTVDEDVTETELDAVNDWDVLVNNDGQDISQDIESIIRRVSMK